MKGKNFKNLIIIITSREPFNKEGNSHTHYLNELKKSNEVLFINPPYGWPPKKIKAQKPQKNLTVVPYFNLLPHRVFKSFASRVNDFLTCILISKQTGNKKIILWQFDPYYLEKISFLNINKFIYFPLDAYFRDKRDALFAKRANILVTVNSTFINEYYHRLNTNILLLPHGFSEFQEHPNLKVASEIKSEYSDYVIFTGSLTQGVDFKLLLEVAKQIFPKNLLIIGKQIVNDNMVEELFSQSNVYPLGFKPLEELKNYIYSSMCCLVTYNKQTGPWRNPIKITDYIAQHKPIINTTPLKDLDILKNKILFTSSDQTEFLNLLQDVLNKKHKVNNSFVSAYIQKNNYKNLVDKIIDFLYSSSNNLSH